MSYQCSRCNSQMEEGLEKGDGGILSAQTWVAGKSDKSFLSGTIFQPLSPQIAPSL